MFYKQTIAVKIVLLHVVKFLKGIFYLYWDGFTGMTVGKKLWLIIILKAIVMYGILKVFFFPNQLEENFNNDRDRSNHVVNELVERGK